ncbi:MAG: PhzF family phenazine biosynthesis protein [Rhodothermales bacterium]|nr:PhzF family phenazine biosynthesis protein [Rhodothermales bacterium]
MPIPLLQIDAFTDVPFRGNPAAVCLLEREAPADWMQRVAVEMNLSETAFLVPRTDGFGLRWFTPAYEVDLCGHATLASAHALWTTGRLATANAARFHTRSGLLTATRESSPAEGRNPAIILNFPTTPPTPADVPDGLLDALDVVPRYVGRSRFDVLVEVEDADAVRRLQPDFAALERVDARGIIVTARGGAATADFVSRFFAPAAGVPEDPVTGSAHCCLAPYWAERLGRSDLVGYQASARGGTVRVRVAGDRVQLSGHAVTVFQGELLTEPSD